jgi:hypothetical protein
MKLTVVPARVRIFCHSQNLFWSLEQINPNEIEAPKVPSGMTGGVEFEAMAYCVRRAFLSPSLTHVLTGPILAVQAAHFRLINAIAKSCPTVEEAFTFHNNLFESGLERVLLVRVSLPSLSRPF